MRGWSEFVLKEKATWILSSRLNNEAVIVNVLGSFNDP
jgi:hypothetical protein